ncbi:MAG: hypothetical protein H0W34_10455 [Pyrinomonadaceae bacterium]|nr:hypothetical protein [Pyrinomonadaceae bacterium]
MAIKRKQVNELLYQALETEQGGIKVYETAVKCAVNDDLKKEWNEYLEQTREHELISAGARVSETPIPEFISVSSRAPPRGRNASIGHGARL